MFKNSLKISKKCANEGNTCIKEPDRKFTRLECVRQNMFRSLANPENKKVSDFVLQNKKFFSDQIDR